jgi:hypothetical protein
MFGLKFKEIDLNKLPLKKMVIIGQFLVIIFFVRSCHLKDLTINSNGVQMQMYEGKANEFEKKANKLGQEVALQNQMVVQKTKEIEKELLKNSLLTKLNEQVKFEASTKIKNILAKYSEAEMNFKNSGDGGTVVITVHDTIKVNGKDSIRTIEGIRVGTKFKADTSQWYKVAGSIEKDGVKFDSLSFKSAFTLNIGEKRVKGYKGWLFGKKEAKVELINPNPYTKVDVMKNIKLEDKKWWENGWVKFGAGVLVGGTIIILAK